MSGPAGHCPDGFYRDCLHRDCEGLHPSAPSFPRCPFATTADPPSRAERAAKVMFYGGALTAAFVLGWITVAVIAGSA